MFKVVAVHRSPVMRPSHYPSTTYRSPTRVTTRGLVVAFAMAALFPVAFVSLAYPIVLAVLAGFGVAGIAFRAALPARRRQRRQLCVPGTGVCVTA